jgi:membrane fusion protein, multidrug efflux system
MNWSTYLRHLHPIRNLSAVAQPVLIAAILLTLICVLGCQHDKPADHVKHESIRPVLSVVAKEDLGPSNGYSGKLDARYSTNLGFRLLGRIVTRQAHLGDCVRKGQVLATLDVADLMVAVRSAEASLAIAKAENENAVNNFRRQATLLEKNATSKAEYDQAKRSEEAAKSAVVQAQSALDKAREVLAYTDLRSDMDGVVTGVYAEVGETVAAGAIVFSVADPGQREAVIDVGAEMLGSIDMASEFRVLVPPLKNECLGKVREIAPQADIETRTSRIKITLDARPEAFRLGATVKAVPVASMVKKLKLPSTAILDRDGGTFVWVVDETNKQVHLLTVTVLDRHENNVIVSSGIKPGDRVVIAGVHSLKDGQSIHVPTGATL